MTDDPAAGELALLRIPAREPLRVVGSDDDIGVMGSVKRTEHYEGDVMLALHELLSPHAVCIDGGANIGLLSLAMSLYADQGQVFAFEPGAENLSFLRRNLLLNHVPNVEVVPLGLWRTSGTMMLNSDPTHPGGSYVGTSDGYSTQESIKVVTVDDWVREANLQRLDLLKLDIEGAEPYALEGAAETIRRFKPTLLIELNPISLRQFQGYDYRLLYRTLREQHRYIGYVRESGGVYWLASEAHLARLLRRKGYVDLVCTHRYPSVSLRHRRRTVRHLRRVASSVREYARLVIQYNRFRPSPRAFLIEPRYAISLEAERVDMVVGEQRALPVTLTNQGTTWWSSSDGVHPVHLAYHLADPHGNVVERDGLRTTLPGPVGPGRSVDLCFQVVAPATPGSYQLQLSLVQERFAWADELDPELRVCLPISVSAGSSHDSCASR